MENLTYNRKKQGEYNLSNSNIDESVLSKSHYKLADFTTEHGQAYAININNKFAYPIIGKRFDKEIKFKYPQFSDERCMTNKALTIEELK